MPIVMVDVVVWRCRENNWEGTIDSRGHAGFKQNLVRGRGVEIEMIDN